MDQSIDEEDESDLDSEEERREAEEAAYQQIYYTTDHSAFNLPASACSKPITRLVQSSGPSNQKKLKSGGNQSDDGKNRPSPVPAANDLEVGPGKTERRGPRKASQKRHLPRHTDGQEGESNYSMLLKLGVNSDVSDDDDDSEDDLDDSISSYSSDGDNGSISLLDHPPRVPRPRKPAKRSKRLENVGNDLAAPGGYKGTNSGCGDDRKGSTAEKSAALVAASSDEVITLSDSEESLRILNSEVEACNLGRAASSDDCVILSSCGHISSDGSSSESVTILDDPPPPLKKGNDRGSKLNRSVILADPSGSGLEKVSSKRSPLNKSGIPSSTPKKSTSNKRSPPNNSVVLDVSSRSKKVTIEGSLCQESSVEEHPFPEGVRNGFYLDKGQSFPSDCRDEDTEGVRTSTQVVVRPDGGNRAEKAKSVKESSQFTPSSRPGSSAGRYFNVKSRTQVAADSKCGRCYCLGHTSDACPELSRPPTCILCGTQGHVCFRCPQKLCFNCDRPGHQSRECPDRYQAPYAQCLRCGMYGHFEEMCPDLWRQYHMTIESGRLVAAKRPNIRTLKKKFCYNCGHAGHLGHMCNEPLMTTQRGEKAPMPTVPIVCQYKMLRGDRLNSTGAATLDDRQVKSGSVKNQNLDTPTIDLSAPVEDNPWTGEDGQKELRKDTFRIPSFYQDKSWKFSTDSMNRINNGPKTTSIFPQQSLGRCSKDSQEPGGVAGGKLSAAFSKFLSGDVVNTHVNGSVSGIKLTKGERRKRRKARRAERKMRKRAKLEQPTEGQGTPFAGDTDMEEEIRIHIKGPADGRTDQNDDDGCVKFEKIVFPSVSGENTKNNLTLKIKKRKQAISRRTRQFIDDVFQPLASTKVANGGCKERGKRGGKKKKQAMMKKKELYERYHYHAPKKANESL